MNILKSLNQNYNNNNNTSLSFNLPFYNNISINDIVYFNFFNNKFFISPLYISSNISILFKSKEHIFINDFFIFNDKIYFSGFLNDNITINNLKLFLSEKNSTDILFGIFYKNNISFLHNIPGLSNDSSISLDFHNNEIYIAGFFNNSSTFGNNYIFKEGKHFFISKFTFQNNEWIWTRYGGFNDKNSTSNCLYVKLFGNKIFCSGYFFGNIFLDTFPDTMISSNGYAIWFAIINQHGEWESFKFIEISSFTNTIIDDENYFFNNLFFHPLDNENFILSIYIDNKFFSFNMFDKKITDFLFFKYNIIPKKINDKDYFFIYFDKKPIQKLKNIKIFDINLDYQNNLIILGSYNKYFKVSHKFIFSDNDNQFFFLSINSDGKCIFLVNIPPSKKVKFFNNNNLPYILLQDNSIAAINNYYFDPVFGIVKSIKNNEAYVEILSPIKELSQFSLSVGKNYYIQKNGKLDITSNNHPLGFAIDNKNIILISKTT